MMGGETASVPVRKEASLRPLTYTTEPAASSSQELADRGFRSLGVAVLYDDEPEPTQEEIAAAAAREEAERSKHGGGHHRQAAAPTPGQGRWQYLGILSLFDPPVSAYLSWLRVQPILPPATRPSPPVPRSAPTPRRPSPPPSSTASRSR